MKRISIGIKLTLYFFIFEIITVGIITVVYYFSEKIMFNNIAGDFPFSGIFFMLIKKYIKYSILRIIITGSLASVLMLIPVYFVIRKITRPFIGLKSDSSAQMISFIDGQEMERQRLSRELHDGLGQSLVAIKMRLETITHVDMSKIRYVLEVIKDMFDKAIDDIRRMSNDLMPVVLNDFGLETATRNLCEHIEESAHIVITFTAGNIPHNLDKKTMTYIYRIIQESLTNIAKHSGADQAEVRIEGEDKTIKLYIADNGNGFDINQAHEGNGNGLYNIHERVGILNGKIQMDSAEGDGTSIHIRIPLAENIKL